MGQLQRRNTGDQSGEPPIPGTVDKHMFMEPCADCGSPVTLVAATKPAVMRCPSCAATAKAAAEA